MEMPRRMARSVHLVHFFCIILLVLSQDPEAEIWDLVLPFQRSFFLTSSPRFKAKNEESSEQKESGAFRAYTFGLQFFQCYTAMLCLDMTRNTSKPRDWSFLWTFAVKIGKGIIWYNLYAKNLRISINDGCSPRSGQDGEQFGEFGVVQKLTLEELGKSDMLLIQHELCCFLRTKLVWSRTQSKNWGKEHRWAHLSTPELFEVFRELQDRRRCEFAASRLMEGLLASIGDSALVKLAELTVWTSAQLDWQILAELCLFLAKLNSHP